MFYWWRKTFKFEDEGQQFAKILRLLEQCIQTVKDQNNFWNGMLFKLVSEGFSDLIYENNYNLDWKK